MIGIQKTCEQHYFTIICQNIVYLSHCNIFAILWRSKIRMLTNSARFQNSQSYFLFSSFAFQEWSYNSIHRKEDTARVAKHNCIASCISHSEKCHLKIIANIQYEHFVSECCWSLTEVNFTNRSNIQILLYRVIGFHDLLFSIVSV